MLPESATDKSPPLGHDAGPNPAWVLLAVVTNCFSTILLFALRKLGSTTGGYSETALLTRINATATSLS